MFFCHMATVGRALRDFSNSILRLLADVSFRRRDWSDHELAHFHRVVTVLRNDGISLETDRGVTDEGEPWFAFCDAESEEVFAHFARISGKYVVYAPCLNGWRTGRVLPDLVKCFESKFRLLILARPR
jgi:hypothetical protein